VARFFHYVKLKKGKPTIWEKASYAITATVCLIGGETG
jgi:hypothetical protein